MLVCSSRPGAFVRCYVSRSPRAAGKGAGPEDIVVTLKRGGGWQGVKLADQACYRPCARADADVDARRGKPLSLSAGNKSTDEPSGATREDKVASRLAGSLPVRTKFPSRRLLVDQKQAVTFRKEGTEHGLLPAARDKQRDAPHSICRRRGYRWHYRSAGHVLNWFSDHTLVIRTLISIKHRYEQP